MGTRPPACARGSAGSSFCGGRVRLLVKGPQDGYARVREGLQALHLQEADRDSGREAHRQEEGEASGHREVDGNASLRGSRRSTTVRVF